MRWSSILLAGLMFLLSACRTPPRAVCEQAYYQWLTDASVTMGTLQALDSGNVEKARKVALTSLLCTLDSLSRFSKQAHPTPEQKREEVQLAREALDYLVVHRSELDPRMISVRIGVRGLQKMLTEPVDVRRIRELSDYLAEAEKRFATQ